MKNLLTIVFSVAMLTGLAFAQTPQDELSQAVAEWASVKVGSKDSDAETLAARERLASKMAAVVARMAKPPAIPEEAEFHATKGAAFFKLAKTPADAANFPKAVKEYQDAVNLAPWIFNYQFNLAVAYTKAGQFNIASSSLKLAKALAATDDERRATLNQRAEIEAAQEMAATATAEAEKAAQAAKAKADADAAAERERLRPTMEGSWGDQALEFQVLRAGERFTLIPGRYLPTRLRWRATDVVIDKQGIRFTFDQPNCPQCGSSKYDLSLSPSGNELTGTLWLSYNGKTVNTNFHRNPESLSVP